MLKNESKKNLKLQRIAVSLLIGLWAMTPGWVNALPNGGDIVSGTGNIQQPTAQDMVIDQTSQQMITNWQGFSIGSTESVTFNQPNSSAIALNRVIGVDPSIILGKLSANGQVFLSNPSGVLFGQNATVDVHGLLATTLDITDQNFLNGNYQFSQGLNPQAAVTNNGIVNATRYAGLLAPAVQNNGSIIVADLGSVALGSGSTATMDFNGDGLISFVVTGEVAGSVLDTQGNVISDRINNSGLIQANGGQVFMTAQSAKDVIGNVINHTGIVEAQTVLHDNGKIVLSSVSQDFSRTDIVDEVAYDQYSERPSVLEERAGRIVITGGWHGNVQVSGALDAARVLVAAGGDKVGTGTVTIAAGKTLTTRNGTIGIIADDLILDGNLDAGTGDVFFGLANGGNLTLSPDGSKGADIGGNELGRITANNLVLSTTGNITVKGMDEANTQGIANSVFLVSGNNIIFNVGDSVFLALEAHAINNINVNQNVTTTQGDFIAKADFDNDGKGNLNVAPSAVITSARDIDVSAPVINAEDSSFNETRDLIINGDVVTEPTLPPEPPLTSVEVESISQGSLGTFLTEFLENGGSSSGGC